jgi:glycosyltransferase involved in cell wall biosynthesis
MFQNVARGSFEILTNSQTSATRIAETAAGMGLVLARPVVVPPPLAPLFMQPAPRSITERRFFLTAGLFTRRKNLGVLVEAAALAERLSGVEPFDIVFVGAPGRDASQILAGWPSQPGRIRLLRAEGLSDHAYSRLLGASAALLAPSLDEGYDYPLHEALASRVRVMASDIGAHREGVPWTVDLLAPGDTAAWARALVEAARHHPQECADTPMSQHARRHPTAADLLRHVAPFQGP